MLVIDRVGIGVSSPAAPLDVTGNIHVRDATGVQHFIQPGGNTIFNERGQDVDFRVEGSGEPNALFVQGSDGHVGIGTNSPEYTLDVTGTDAAALPAEQTHNVLEALMLLTQDLFALTPQAVNLSTGQIPTTLHSGVLLVTHLNEQLMLNT